MSKQVSQDELVDVYATDFNKNTGYRMLKRLRRETRFKSSIFSKTAGAIVTALGHLLSALDNPELPKKYRAMIMGAVAYIVLPVDLIPDALPVIGFSDDLASAAAVVSTVKNYSTFNLAELDAQIDKEILPRPIQWLVDKLYSLISFIKSLCTKYAAR